ncbi:carbonic anhydrase [Nocardia nepalensis]|uniref:carbonic anhydrase n=1 Tax=Nocardia nepalensis TaxID=3375448 RepID=UPI003B683C4D
MHDLGEGVAQFQREVVNSEVAQLVRQNVLAQLTNLATHPSVARRIAEHSLTLHGWVFDIPTGTVEELRALGHAAALAG